MSHAHHGGHHGHAHHGHAHHGSHGGHDGHAHHRPLPRWLRLWLHLVGAAGLAALAALCAAALWIMVSGAVSDLQGHDRFYQHARQVWYMPRDLPTVIPAENP